MNAQNQIFLETKRKAEEEREAKKKYPFQVITEIDDFIFNKISQSRD